MESLLFFVSKVLLINVPKGGLLLAETTDLVFCCVVGEI